MKSSAIARVVAAVAVALAMTACGAQATKSDSQTATAQQTPLDQVQPADDPRSLTGPATAVLADRVVEPVAKAPKPELPITVTSKDRGGDKAVTVTDTDRVLALDMAGSIAATVWGLGHGDRLVGRDVSTDFPGVEDLPVVTSNGHSLNAESVLKVRPTLVITDGSIGPRDVVEQLRSAGVTVVFVENDQSFDGAQELARDVAEVLGTPEVGQELAAQIGQQVQAVQSQISDWIPTSADRQISMAFLYLRGSSGVYYLLGEDSGVSDLIRGLGGIDVAEREGWEDSQPLTDEAVVAANPDLFLVMTDGLESVGGVDQLLADKASIALTQAGKNKRFVDMADADVLSFGPRSAGVLEALARAVYAPGSP